MKKIKNLIFIFCLISLFGIILIGCGEDNEKTLPTRLDYTIEDTYVCVDQSKKVNLKITPSDADGVVRWVSEDDGIVSVSNDGIITGVTTGKTIVSAISEDNPAVSVSFFVTSYAVPTSMICYGKDTTMAIGTQLSFRTSVSPSNANPYIKWSSSDNSVISIDENGVATANKLGSATISGVSVGNSSLVFERTIEVINVSTGIEISASKQSDYIGKTIQLTAILTPSDISSPVIWSSSNEEIATVDENGVVTLVGRGEFIITGKASDNQTISSTIKLTSLHPLLEEENSDVKYIICAPGTDASTMISINYHAKNTKTSIEYTLSTDPEFKCATTALANGVYFEELSEALNGPFEARNVYSLEIDGLTPNTDYIYRINKGDGTYSETYNFRTASNEADDFSFVWLTDNHYNTIYEGAEVSEYTIHEAMKKRDHISFVFDTGDMIDTGGNSEIWDKMFSMKKTLLELPLISTTGNHELYVNGTAQWDNRFHAAYNALPKNGVEKKVGTSCYYYYNDVLFIIFENVSATSYDLQYAWMENLLKDARENNRAKLVIAACHAPIQSESASDSKNDRDPKIMELFEKYAVDLVLTGHYHTDNESKNYWQGSRVDNDLLGVNYLIGDDAGAKGSSNSDIEALKSIAKGYIVDIIGTTIKVTQIDASGKELSVRTYSSKKYEQVSDEAKKTSKETIVDSLSYALDQTTPNITFTWSSLAYGNVSKIIFKELNRSEEEKEVYIINSAYTSTSMTNALNYYNSKFEATFYFNDGTVKTKIFDINRGPTINLEYSCDGTISLLTFNALPNSIKNIVKQVDFYLDGEKLDSLTYNVQVRSYILNHLSDGSHNVTLKFYNSSNILVFESSLTFNA